MASLVSHETTYRSKMLRAAKVNIFKKCDIIISNTDGLIISGYDDREEYFFIELTHLEKCKSMGEHLLMRVKNKWASGPIILELQFRPGTEQKNLDEVVRYLGKLPYKCREKKSLRKIREICSIMENIEKQNAILISHLETMMVTSGLRKATDPPIDVL